jgi:hypothetical protein
MTPRADATCAPHDPAQACRARYEAVAAGRFFWQDFVGWLWRDSVDRFQPWDFCPWCGETLPTLTPYDILDRVRQCDGFDGEEGG